MQSCSRRSLLARGAVLALTAAGAGALAGAAAADVPPDSDLAYARLLVAADLLAADFYGRALAAKVFGAPEQKTLRHAAFNEQEHYAAVAGVLTAAGQTPATAADIDFTYPAKAFAARGSVAKLGADLEQLQLGAYLGAADAVQTEPLRGIVSRIAANEAQHLAVFTGLHDDRPLGVSLPLPLAVDAASNALAAYTS
ncbi:MAG TPA: ferritin-like domain-containing protein [Gaiellaceae bacterium]|nr:ferritin-like domain-containing protein [Gaiellaceae bacterium]